MATLNLAQRTAILMLLLNLALTGCWGGNLASSPQEENREAETVQVEPRTEAAAPLAPAKEAVQAVAG